MKNFRLLALLSLAFSVSPVVAGNDMSSEYQRLCKLRDYANKKLKAIDYCDPQHVLDMYLSRAMKQASAAEFDGLLREAKAVAERHIELFAELQQKSMEKAKDWERIKEKKGDCFRINGVARTWLHLKTYFAEGQGALDPNNCEDKKFLLDSTSYERCSVHLSGIQYYTEHAAELGKQIKVLEKIRSRLNECLRSEPTQAS